MFLYIKKSNFWVAMFNYGTYLKGCSLPLPYFMRRVIVMGIGLLFRVKEVGLLQSAHDKTHRYISCLTMSCIAATMVMKAIQHVLYNKIDYHRPKPNQ
jgi:hypothetical protein